MSVFYAGFDMGIRNLAFCVLEHKEDGKKAVIAWDNVDLLEGGASSQTALGCAGCNAKAKWIWTAEGTPSGIRWCQGCATGVRRKKTAVLKPAQSVLPCKPEAKPLKALAVSLGVAGAKTLNKADLLVWAKSVYLMPWKAEKAMSASLDTLRKAIALWLNSVLPTMARCAVIRIENQPVMTNPTMKSVQMILYTLLAYRLETEHGWTGTIDFVHAGVKSKKVATTDISGAAGKYKARKDAAEVDVAYQLGLIGDASWITFFEGRTKKSDLADAFLMAFRSP